MATIDKRVYPNGSTSYRARTRLKGFPPESASFARLTEAKIWAASRESAQREGRYVTIGAAKRHTLADLIARYERDVLPCKPRNARNQRQQLRWWSEQLGNCRLSDLSATEIAECRDYLLKVPMANGKRRSNSTAVRYLAVLSHALSVAMREWNWVDDNPCRKVTKPKEPRGRVRFLDDAERNRLLESCRLSMSALLYPIVVLALSTGMRKGEILNLRWPQVDLVRGHITLHDTKNGDRRGVPLASLARSLLQELHDNRGSDTDLVFPGRVVSKPLEVTKAWTTALAVATIENFRFHDLRHSAASYLVMDGASMAEVGDVLGHKCVQMTKRYAHLATGHTTHIVATMNERIFRDQ